MQHSRWRRWAMGLICAAVVLPACARDAGRPLAAAGTIEVFFSPWEDAEGALIAALESSRKQVLVQAFLLTSRKIATSLIAAHRRGVDVQVLADARQHADNAGSRLSMLSGAGIPVRLETGYRHAHNKVIVIDAADERPVVITGSYNYTGSAQKLNAENLLILRGNPALAERYADNWRRHQSEASPLRPQ